MSVPILIGSQNPVTLGQNVGNRSWDFLTCGQMGQLEESTFFHRKKVTERGKGVASRAKEKAQLKGGTMVDVISKEESV